jgi:hypothetical protein
VCNFFNKSFCLPTYISIIYSISIHRFLFLRRTLTNP